MSISGVASRWALVFVVLLLTVTAWFGKAAAQNEAHATAAGPSAADLAGIWVAYASHDGESSPLILHLDTAEGGALRGRWSTPAIHVWEVGLPPVSVQGDEVKIENVIVLHYDRAAGTLTGTLPAFWVPVYPMQVTFRRSRPQRPEPAAPIAAPVWTFDAKAAVWADLAFAKGVLFVGADDGQLHALDAGTGKPSWNFHAGGAIRACPRPAGGDLFVQADDGYLYRLNAASGEQRWRARLEPPVVRHPLDKEDSNYDYRASGVTIADRRLFVGTHDGHLLALDPADGSRLWDFATAGSVLSTPAVDSGRVYFGSFDGNVYALAAASGALLWKHDTGAPVSSSPALHEGRVIIGSRSYDLMALDGASGKPAWTRYYWFSWVESSATILGGSAYVGSSDAAKLFAFDARSGRRLWDLDAGGCAWGRPAVNERRVYIGTVGTQHYIAEHRAMVLAVDRATGLPSWRYPVAAPAAAPRELAAYGFAGSPVLGAGLVYFAGLDGRVQAFKP
ncbi:MAG TPA: PQQ-binding-like beta-propeller repeat protein [Thermoanaerobaculia bacterium]|nr:PQQ-binding-like beta-propeller repeat protein [Thermoanaerobaculia bacterium]